MLPILAAALLAATPAADDPQAAAVRTATEQMSTGRPAEALATIEPALAAYERQYAGERRQIFCAGTPTETIAAMAQAAAAKRDAVALAGGWCDALFIKGFSLIDLKRLPEATVVFERLVAMAPFHAQYLSELAYIYQQQRDWQKSYDTYGRARDVADFAGEERKAAERGRALRGMGFALIEQGKWDEAEAIYDECLRLDLNDAKAKNELRYIQQQRRRPRA